MYLALAALALVGALSLTACGAGSAVSTPVAKAADKAVSTGSEHIDFHGTVTASGMPATMTGSGDFRTDPKIGSAHLVVKGGGKELAVEEILSGTQLYMKSPLFAKAMPSGKSWIYLDLAKANRLGMNLNAYAQASPTDTLQALRQAGSVTKLGQETIAGVPTTHYRARIDYSKVADAKVARAANLRAAPVDVWIDANNLLRRMRLAYSSSTTGGKVSATMNMDFSKYGEQVNVQVPDAGETLDMTKLGG